MQRLTVSNLTAWLLFALVSAWSLYAAGSTLAAGNPGENPLGAAVDFLNSLYPIVFVIPALLIITRQRNNRIGRILLFVAVVAVITDMITHYLTGLQGEPLPQTLPIFAMVWFGSWYWLLLIISMLLIALLFPTGRLHSPRWRWVFYLAAATYLYFVFIVTASEAFEFDFPPYLLENPIGFLPLEANRYLSIPLVIMLVLFVGASLASMVIRYRDTNPVERQQMKWLMYALILFGLTYTAYLFFYAFFRSQVLFDLTYLLFLVAVAAVPTAIAIGILRYNLFDIDVIIRLTLTYALVTGLLGAIYFGGVILIQQVFVTLTGQTSNLAIVMITLAVAAAFNPLRQRVQTLIDRRFYRQKYNVEQALADFSAAARRGSNLDELTTMLEGVIQTNLQPTHVILLLRSSDSAAEEM